MGKQFHLGHLLLVPPEGKGDHFREEEEEDEAEEEEREEDEPENGDTPNGGATEPEGEEVLESERMEVAGEANGLLDLAERAALSGVCAASQTCRLGGGRMYMRRTSSSYSCL